VKPVLERLELTRVHVRGPTDWLFVRVTDSEGTTGLGEAVPRALDAIRALWPRLEGAPAEDDAAAAAQLDVADAEGPTTDELAAASALRCALADLFARRVGQSLCAYLGGSESPSPVEVYANINRSMLPDDEGPRDRSPAAFAAAARAALDAGFGTVKCAPFDEARAPFDTSGLPSGAMPGLERLAAVRAEIGPDVPLYVDCHRRFDLDASLALEPELRALGVVWFEEPVDVLAAPEAMRAIRDASMIDVPGAELAHGARLFERLIAEGTLDVAMPDVLLCGGSVEAAAAARAVEAIRPGSASLHCPGGPVALLHSAHVTAAVGASRPLEHAVHEAPWRSELLTPRETFEAGALVIPPGPGVGAWLDEAVLAARGEPA
jgi:galactonate dehydratase